MPTSDASRSIFTIASNPLGLTSHSSTKCARPIPCFRSYVVSFDFVYPFDLTSPTDSEPPLWSVVHRSFHCIIVHPLLRACAPGDPNDGVFAHTQAHPGTHAYFKSTDGHHGNWSFNLRRPNLHLLPIAAAHGGYVFSFRPSHRPTLYLDSNTGSFSSTRRAQANVSQTRSPKPYRYGAPSSTAPCACGATGSTPFFRTGWKPQVTRRRRGHRGSGTGICALRLVSSVRTSTRR